MTREVTALPKRFQKRVAVDDKTGCWNWTGTLLNGYGRIYLSSLKTVPAHRYIYSLLVQAVPAPLVLDHLCRNTRCVNPAHLEPVTNRENILRGISPSAINAVKTHCTNGHEFTPTNTRIRSDGNRDCKTCMRINPGKNKIRDANGALRRTARVTEVREPKRYQSQGTRITALQCDLCKFEVLIPPRRGILQAAQCTMRDHWLKEHAETALAWISAEEKR